MFPNYTAGPAGCWLRTGGPPLPAQPDLLVFDVDGVLINTDQSYPECISQAVQTYFTRVLKWPGAGQLVQAADSALFKQAGGFNSDWELAMAAVLFYLAKAARIGMVDLEALHTAPPTLTDFTAAVRRAGGGLGGAEKVALAGLPGQLAEGLRRDWDRALIAQICEEYYGGDDWCPAMFGRVPQYVHGKGLFNLEVPIIQPERLLGWPGSLGIYTGRVSREAGPALQRCGLADLVPATAILAADGRFIKPDPNGLLELARQTGTRSGIFFGDNVDDLRTVLRYRTEAPDGSPPFFFAGILGGALGDQAAAIFTDMGADIIAPDVNAALAIVC